VLEKERKAVYQRHEIFLSGKSLLSVREEEKQEV